MEEKQADIDKVLNETYSGVYIIPNTVFKEKEYTYWCCYCNMDIGYYASQCSICGQIYGEEKPDQG